MLTLLARRLAFGVLTLLLISMLVFWATQFLPGDAAQAVLGRSATPEMLDALRRQLHLDDPAPLQYGRWLAGVLTGDPGVSLANQKPILPQIIPRVLRSLALLGLTAAIAIPLAIIAGLWAAFRSGGKADGLLTMAALGLAAIPEFVVAIGLIALFSTVVFQWLPPVSMLPANASLFSRPAILVLPVATLTLIVFPYIFRMVRAATVDVLRSDYIEAARLRGLPVSRLMFVHALPNAMGPAVQVVALTLAYLAGGIVVIEYVYGFPGIGQGLINAVISRDIPAIQLIVLMLAGFYVVANLVADIVIIMITPRLRVSPK